MTDPGPPLQLLRVERFFVMATTPWRCVTEIRILQQLGHWHRDKPTAAEAARVDYQHPTT